MIIELLFLVGAICFYVAIYDIFLKEEQKRQIDIRFFDIWNKLDDYKKQPYEIIAKDKHFNIGILLLTLLVPIAVISHNMSQQPNKGIPELAAVIWICYVIFGSIYGLAIMRWSFYSNRYKLKSKLLIGMISSAVFLVLSIFYIYRKTIQLQNKETIVSGFEIIIGAFGGMFLTLFVMFSPFIFVQSLAVIIPSAEFVLRKLIEYPKGPIIGVGAICFAIGGYLRSIPV